MFRKKTSPAPAAAAPRPEPSPVERAASGNWEVRKGVAADPRTPVELLVRLANDESEYVREAVAANTSTPGDALRRLADYRPEFCFSPMRSAAAVLKNPATPPELLTELAAEARGEGRRKEPSLSSNSLKDIASNPSLAEADMERMAKDGEEIQLALLENPSLPHALIQELADSPHTTVRVMNAASARLGR